MPLELALPAVDLRLLAEHQVSVRAAERGQHTPLVARPGAVAVVAQRAAVGVGERAAQRRDERVHGARVPALRAALRKNVGVRRAGQQTQALGAGAADLGYAQTTTESMNCHIER